MKHHAKTEPYLTNVIALLSQLIPINTTVYNINCTLIAIKCDNLFSPSFSHQELNFNFEFQLKELSCNKMRIRRRGWVVERKITLI